MAEISDAQAHKIAQLALAWWLARERLARAIERREGNDPDTEYIEREANAEERLLSYLTRVSQGIGLVDGVS